MTGRNESPLSALPGVGPQRLAQLQRLGLFSPEDLLRFYPRGYEDRRSVCPIARLEEGAAVCVRALVAEELQHARLPGGRTMSRTRAFDESGMLELTFFNRAYLRLERGRDYVFFGKPVFRNGHFAMVNPSVELSDDPKLTGKLLPVYHLSGKLTQQLMRSWVQAALNKLKPDDLPEFLPEASVEQWKLCSPLEALQFLHTPENPEQVLRARRRLLFEQLFCFCCANQMVRQRHENFRHITFDIHPPELFFAELLPMLPTRAQYRAVAQAFMDLGKGRRMNRLLQGDVGSGKTLVAAACLWQVFMNGYQSVMMAPTELLARQHQQTLEKILAPFNVPVELLVSAMPAAEKRRVLARAASEEPIVLVGTHALIQKTVELPRAALVVIDEQHRFGVAQRAALSDKIGRGHLLAMSATPIPRTLTLILYGDLDVSVLDEMPPGRQPVKTFAITERKREGLYGFIQKEAEAGGQTYIVCPMIEDEDDTSGKKAAVEYVEQLKKALPRLRIGLMHGRLRPAEKEAVMAQFAAGELDVLVSTTVIEVGVDVPNATTMVVENADSFGLSQLHQLRGRVGRGKRQSYCFLMNNARSEQARARLKILCETSDGFRIAETDLRLRGPGDFFGQRQSGLPSLSLTDAAGETRMIESAQECAAQLLDSDPELDDHPLLRDRVRRLMERTLASGMN